MLPPGPKTLIWAYYFGGGKIHCTAGEQQAPDESLDMDAMRSERFRRLLSAEGPFASVYFDDSHGRVPTVDGAFVTQLFKVPTTHTRVDGRSGGLAEGPYVTTDRYS